MIAPGTVSLLLERGCKERHVDVDVSRRRC